VGRPRSENGYKVSRLNSLRHGLFTEGIMLSRGSEVCPHRRSCQVLRDDGLRPSCVPGDECPMESAFYRLFLKDARATFLAARDNLSESEFERLLHELAIVELQRQRLSGLIAQEGSFRPKKHPVSGYEYGLEETLGAGRYATSLDNRFMALMERLLYASPILAVPAVPE